MLDHLLILFVCLMLAASFYFIAVLVDRWDEQKNIIKGLKAHILGLEEKVTKLEGRIEAHTELFSEMATQEDLDREAAAMLNVRNDIGKLGNRIQVVEREIRK